MAGKVPNFMKMRKLGGKKIQPPVFHHSFVENPISKCLFPSLYFF